MDGDSTTWAATVAALAERGLELSDILAFHVQLLEEKVFFEPASSTTKDVVFHAVIPMTQAKLCSYATLVNDGRPLKAQRFVTHIWGNVYTDTIAAIVADALGVPIYERHAQQLTTVDGTMAVLDKVRRAGRASTVYWLCCFSINQHKSICNRAGASRGAQVDYPVCGCLLEKCTTGALSEMNKFADMMATLHLAHGLTQVIALDTDFQLFTRAWCVAELVEAQRQGMPQKLVLHSTAAVESHREHLERLTVRECKATDPQDLEEIMNNIEDIDVFDMHLRELLLNKNTGLLAGWQRAIHGYFFRWDEFSPAYLKQLSIASEGSAWRILAVALGPVAVIAPSFAFFPYPEPDTPEEATYITWTFLPPLYGLCYVGLVQLVLAMAQLEWRQLHFKIIVSAVLMIMVVQSGVISMWYHILGEHWPLPWGCAFQTPTCAMIVGYSWFAIPKELRNNAACRRKCGMAMAAVFLIIVLWAVAGPLLCGCMSLSKSVWIHSLLAAALLSLKLASERAVTVVMKSLTADVLPIFIFACSTSYEMLLCSAVSRVGAQRGGGEGSWQNWSLFIQLIGFDVVENCFHLWTLARQGGTETVSRKPSGLNQEAQVSRQSSMEGRDQLILAQLVLREFLEICAPVKFLIVLVGLDNGHRRQNDLVCQWTDSDFEAVLRMVVLETIIEIVVAAATWFVLQRQGKRPLRLLAGLVKQHFWCFFLWDICNVVIRIFETSRMGGSDYTFQFKWMRAEGATWDCGLQWTLNS